MQLGADTVLALDHVRMLGVIISADLSLDLVCPSSVRRPSTGYDTLTRRWIDSHTGSRLRYARVDYCNLLLAGAPKSFTDKLQRVMNAAARVVSGTKKYDHGLTHLLHSELHWLDVADRVTYKLGVMVHKCLHGQAPDYLSELCTPVAQVADRQHQPPSTRFSKVSAGHVRPSHLRCRWTNDMELVPWQFAWTEHAYWLLSSHTEDVRLWTILSTSSALVALFSQWCAIWIDIRHWH